MIPMLLVLSVAVATEIQPVTAESTRRLVGGMLSSPIALAPRHLLTLRTVSPRTPAYWAGALTAIAQDARKYQPDDLRAALLDDLHYDAVEARLTDAPGWPDYRAAIRVRLLALVEKYGRRHKQRIKVTQILTALHLWTALEAEHLTHQFWQLKFIQLAVPWMRLARREPAAFADVLPAMFSANEEKRPTPYLVLLAGLAAAPARTADLIHRVIVGESLDYTSGHARSTRLGFRAHRRGSARDAALYRAEANLWLRETFTRIRVDLKRGEPETKMAFERAVARSEPPTTPRGARHARLLEWLRSDQSPEFFDVDLDGCAGVLDETPRPPRD